MQMEPPEVIIWRRMIYLTLRRYPPRCGTGMTMESPEVAVIRSYDSCSSVAKGARVSLGKANPLIMPLVDICFPSFEFLELLFNPAVCDV